MKASTKRKEGGRRWRNDLLVEVTSFATLKTSSSCTSCGLLLVFGFIPLSKVHWFWFGFIFGLIHELENKNKKGNITCLPSASRLLEFPRILFSRCFLSLFFVWPIFLSEAQEKGLERMEGRGLGDVFKNVSLCICCFLHVRVLAIRVLFSWRKRPDKRFGIQEKWVEDWGMDALPADDQWWKGNRGCVTVSACVCVCVCVVCVCVCVCVILLKVEKNPSKLVWQVWQEKNLKMSWIKNDNGMKRMRKSKYFVAEVDWEIHLRKVYIIRGVWKMVFGVM